MIQGFKDALHIHPSLSGCVLSFLGVFLSLQGELSPVSTLEDMAVYGVQ